MSNMRVAASILLTGCLSLLAACAAAESVCIEDGNGGGHHTATDVPSGACADPGKVCTLIASGSCPTPVDVPPAFKWTCECTGGSWSCSSTGYGHHTCPPATLDAGSD